MTRTAERLKRIGIRTVEDIFKNEKRVIDLLGNYGTKIIELALFEEVGINKTNSDKGKLNDFFICIATEVW